MQFLIAGPEAPAFESQRVRKSLPARGELSVKVGNKSLEIPNPFPIFAFLFWSCTYQTAE
jgi:hypothetical protein